MGCSGYEMHVITEKKAPYYVDLSLDDLRGAVHEVIHSDIGHHPVGGSVKRALSDTGEMKYCLAQCFGRNGSAMNSLTADIRLAVDDGDTFPTLSCLECGPLSCRPSSDDCDVVKLSLDYFFLMNPTVEL